MESAGRAGRSYQRVRIEQRTHPVRVGEVPVEHAVSLPLPTLRWGRPAYAQFASPAVRRPEAFPEQGPPDRWWAVDAVGGQLVVYALTSAIPLAQGVIFGAASVPPLAPTLDGLRALLAELDDAMDAVTPDFFAGSAGDPASRRRARDRLAGTVPAPLVLAYRSLAPDFYGWLEA